MKKILLLGANGQLGTDLNLIFSEVRDVQLINAYRSDIDMEFPEQVSPYLEKRGDFDVVINCTSYHKTDECEDFPLKAFSINSASVAELAKYCNKNNKVLFHISTDYVFSGKKDIPYSEIDREEPLSVYGNSKLAGEHFIQSYHDKYFIFRVSSLFGQAGASGKGGNFVETMIKLAKEGKPLKVVSDQIMSPTHTLDIARALCDFIVKDVNQYGIYNCSGEGQCSWYDFAREIFLKTNMDVELSPVLSNEYKTKARRPKYSVLDNRKINQFYPMPLWQEALEEYLLLKGHI
ncbi:dTDP-4-dehydrorhamnose reductase [Paenibacillus sp. y28]|uniref:dTDP-4-dehydrorhamnose reductase n=1 Tax=Paenibacillus sp. y28 TaxID=3129110 RepID=UPI0030189E11